MAIIEWLRNKLLKSCKDQFKPQLDTCVENLQSVEDTLRKLQKRDRRQGQLLESMHQELSNKMDGVCNRIDTGIPYDSIYDFAANFALFLLHYHNPENGQQSLWSKFNKMLQDLDMELILDLNSPFDETRHTVCDTRTDPERPEGIILEVVQPGLIINGQMKKSAVVVINKYAHEE